MSEQDTKNGDNIYISNHNPDGILNHSNIQNDIENNSILKSNSKQGGGRSRRRRKSKRSRRRSRRSRRSRYSRKSRS